MKRIISMVVVVVLVITGAVLVTLYVSNKSQTKKFDNVETTSDIYEVVEFIPPQKTVYTLSELTIIDVKDKNGEKKFMQQLEFDGTGMSITVRNTKTDETQKYEYSCEYYYVDGVAVASEDNLSFKFDPGLNVILTPGVYTAQVVLITDDGECVLQNMNFTLIKDPKTEETKEPTTQPTQEQAEQTKPTNEPIPNENKNPTESKKPTQNKTESSNEKQEKPTDEIVMPPLKTIWHHLNNPNGYTLQINNQHGNTFDLTISAVNENATKVATAKVTITLQDVHFHAGTRGEDSFAYTDSFGNSGTGTISVSENMILLDINEEYNSGKGFGISYNTGKYMY